MNKTATIWTVIIVVVLIIIGVLVYRSNGNGSNVTATSTDQAQALPSDTSGGAATAMPEPQNTGSSTINATTSPVSSGAKGSVVLTAMTDKTLGTYLVASNGMTVYTYNKDTATASACTGSCATAWPPYTVDGTIVSFAGGTGVGGAISVITRPDGSRQITYNNKPLYFWQGDAKAGDTKGNGVGGFAIVRE